MSLCGRAAPYSCVECDLQITRHKTGENETICNETDPRSRIDVLVIRRAPGGTYEVRKKCPFANLPVSPRHLSLTKKRLTIRTMMRESESRRKPLWTKPNMKPNWWNTDILPWANTAKDTRTSFEKELLTFGDVLSELITTGYLYYGVADPVTMETTKVSKENVNNLKREPDDTVGHILWTSPGLTEDQQVIRIPCPLIPLPVEPHDMTMSNQRETLIDTDRGDPSEKRTSYTAALGDLIDAGYAHVGYVDPVAMETLKEEENIFDEDAYGDPYGVLNEGFICFDDDYIQRRNLSRAF